MKASFLPRLTRTSKILAIITVLSLSNLVNLPDFSQLQAAQRQNRPMRQAAMTAATLSAPTDIVGTPGNFVDIPLFLDTGGHHIGALGAAVKATNGILSFDSFETGQIVPGSAFGANALAPDSVRIAFADFGGGPITSSGVLAKLRFQISSAAAEGDSAVLRFSLTTAADPAGFPLSISNDSGLVSVSLTVLISGNVLYCDSTGAGDPQKPVADLNAEISSAGTVLENAQTDSSGAYRFSELTPNTDYRVEISRESGGLENEITPGDAFLAFGMYLSDNASGCQALAADVNGDKEVTPGDALRIFERFLGGVTSFPVDDWAVFPASFDINAAEAWKSIPAGIDLENLTLHKPGQHFNAVGAGDVDLSFSADSAASSSYLKKAASHRFPLVFSLENISGSSSGEERMMQIRIHGSGVRSGVYAFGGELRYNASSVKILAIQKAGAIPGEGFLINYHDFPNPGETNASGNRLNSVVRFGGFATSSRKIQTEGALVNLKIRLIKTLAHDTKIPLELSNAAVTLALPPSPNRIFQTVAAEVRNDATFADALPPRFELQANYPNPFNPETKIRWQLPTKARLSLIIFDALGRTVRILLNNESREAGYYEYVWDGRDENGAEAASGVYFYRVRVFAPENSFTRTRGMLLIR